MYIPIGPSKKDLYKIIIALLLVVYLIFLGMYKPKAQTITEAVYQYQYNSGTTQQQVKNFYMQQAPAFKNVGDGKLIFTTTTMRNNVPIWQISAILSNGIDVKNSICNIGNMFNYADNTNEITTYSVLCDVSINNNYYLDHIEIQFYGNTYMNIWLSQYITFSNTDNETQVIVSGLQELFDTTNAYILDNTNHISSVENFLQDITNKLSSIILKLDNNNTTINNIQNNTQNISDSINDSSIDSSSASNFTSNSAFQDSNGLDAIIKAPLNFIRSLTSSTCSSINLTIPYINAQVSLPCMSTIYNKALGSQLVNLIALVINGVVLYRYCLKILELVHNAKNPNKDELEVLDL